MQEDLQQQVAGVPQLALKLPDGTDAALVFLRGDLQAQLFAHHGLHPAGIQEDELAVLRDRGGIGIEEGIAGFALRDHRGGNHVVEPGINLADEFLDQAALAGGRPALDEDQDGQLLLPDLLLLADQAGAKLLDFFVQDVLVLRFALFKIL